MKWFQIGLAALLSGTSGNVQACMWDRDTLAQEAQGIPDVIRVITGRFERNPPRYYEMRLQRIEAEHDSAPESEKLALCDDAGVACDRLHRGDEAIAWMEKKNQLLEALAESDEKREHTYRYYANLGTFVIHRWLRDGAARERFDEAEKARALIATAIKLNPEAHFGREKYQLKAIEWLIDLDELAAADASKLNYDPRSFLKLPRSRHSESGREIEDAVEGITGLIALGDAWESIDVFLALKNVLVFERQEAIAYLASLRIRELREAGKRSLFPNESAESYGMETMTTHKKSIESFFRKARKEANAWQKARNQFMEKQFAAGKHPDTDPDFWEAFRYSGKAPNPPHEIPLGIKLAGLLFVILISIPLTVWGVRRLRQRFPDSPSAQAAILLGGVAAQIAIAIGTVAVFAAFVF